MFRLKKPKTPSETLLSVAEWAAKTDQPTPPEHAAEELSKSLALLRRLAWARTDDPPEPDAIASMAREVYKSKVLYHLVRCLPLLDFDARRDVASLFAFMLKRQPTAEYLARTEPQILEQLVQKAGDVETHRTCCTVLRECARQQLLCTFILQSKLVWVFFKHVKADEFEVATDNFATLQCVLLNYSERTRQFLSENFDLFTQLVNGLIASENYVAKRQSLKLLYTILSSQRNNDMLVRYASQVDSLKLVMQQLRLKSRNIHYDAFQLFKVFVANPYKPQAVNQVLFRNRDKLIELFSREHVLGESEKDHIYQMERKYVKAKLSRISASQASQASPANLANGLSAANTPNGHSVHTPNTPNTPNGHNASTPNGHTPNTPNVAGGPTAPIQHITN